MAAGSLDRRITIERMGPAGVNDFNETIIDWVPLATVWASRRDVSDGEKFSAGQVGSMLQSRFVVRSNTVSRDFKPTDRLVYDGATWNIFGIKETADGRKRFLEITAARDTD